MHLICIILYAIIYIIIYIVIAQIIAANKYIYITGYYKIITNEANLPKF